MSFRWDLSRRLTKEWAARLGLVVIVAAAGLCTIAFSVAQVMVKANPALAYRLAPYDGRITAAYATALSGVDATPEERTLSNILAKRALSQDPTAVAAAATIGLNADVRNERELARRYFIYSQKLSRRDLRTQLFMIEDAVSHGNIVGAVHQYDISLRVYPDLGEVLYPVLASASSNSAIRRELVRTLRGKPIWSSGFLEFMVGKGPDPKATAALFLDLRSAGVSLSESDVAGVVNSLVAARQFDAAWSFYAANNSGADRRFSRDPHFTAKLQTPSSFDWVPINEGAGLTADVQSGVFDFAGPPSVGGPVLRQLQLLPAGRYRLRGHSTSIDQLDSARPYWVLRCQNGRELGRLDLPNSRFYGGNFTGVFSVSGDCPVQDLVLITRASDAISGLIGQIDRAALVPEHGQE